jgi:hypothetical protein
MINEIAGSPVSNPINNGLSAKKIPKIPYSNSKTKNAKRFFG